MSQKSHIDIKVTIDELRLSLQKLIKSEHSSLIADVIIENLKTTEVGLGQFFKALSGIKESIPFNILDEVYVDYDKLHSWYQDKDEMIKEGMIFKNCIKATIININTAKNYPIEIEYIGKEVDKEPEKHTKYVSLDKIYSIKGDFLEPDSSPF